ncbi:hybrid sensor histidine kinase/response regulator [Leptospira perolatii]|uniref:histidine kinase n=1 Tax=Leptospira perolatii TaxID=2023191 RepID=A0A2M9ZJU1_9LEPT|nr:response regulator [Leptospira perolatii]PJZ69477.1 hybrid sensor histidine kinase/response regulator [Leptospira perolatii]PJZ72302.1 hybrid sensor histidine kinase/response regulator [Leptospira perolatii]
MIVLIVDDSSSNRRLLTAQLAGLGHNVLSATDGRDALEILENTNVDLIISDILMPGMDGYQFCNEVRQSPKFCDLPFIFYTATYTSQSDERFSIDLGADIFLRKPASLRTIMNTIDEVMRIPKEDRKIHQLFKEEDTLKEYNSRLVEKLEEKNFELRRRTEELELEIEERKNFENRIKESEERFRQLTDAIREVFWMTNLEQTEILYISHAYEEVWGRSCESLYKDPDSWWKAIHPEDRLRVHQGLIPEKHMQAEYTEEYRIIRSDGSIRWIQDRSFPVRNEKGEVIRIAGIAEDTTERVNREQKLKEIEAKRKELQEQLVQAQKFESLGTLASGIAHDFNNILTILLGHISILGHIKSNPDKFSRSVDALQKTAQRGAALVQQLLTFARKTEFKPELIQLNDIVIEVHKLLDQTIPKNIKIDLKLDKELPLMLADSNQIHQVLLNLCVNGRDAMPKGGSLCLETKVISGTGNLSLPVVTKGITNKYLLLKVSDTGIGMDENTRRKVFEPFFTTKGPGKGTGLGLALVYSIVEKHFGSIEIDSELGKGTTVRIFFPIPQEEITVEKGDFSGIQEIPGGKETVLFIEDEIMLRDLIRTMLEFKGYAILTAADGEEGVSIFNQRKEDISLVITDYGLPKLTGSEVFSRIKDIKPEVKMILATGFIDPEIKADLSDMGVSRFIQKPYFVSEVFSAIREVLDS